MDPDFWEDRYRNQQTGWDRGGTSPALRHWLDAGELTPCRIVIPGAGRGHEALSLARRGFDVTALDFADSAVRELRDALAREGLSARVEQADVLRYAPAEPFDAAYEQTCLCALEPDDWQAYVRRLHAWLKPGGRLYALFMQTGREGGPPFHCDLNAMHALFPKQLWEWPTAALTPVPHPNGFQELAAVLVRREGGGEPGGG